MNKDKIIKLVVLLFLWDRVEFLYYLVEGNETKIGFIIQGDPIRIDSYVYFASIAIQQVITATIFYILLPWDSVKWFLVACILCFIEYFFTYGTPIAKIPLPWNLYVPISASGVRMVSVCYFSYDAVKRLLEE